MSTTTTVQPTAATTCPAWCSDHLPGWDGSGEPPHVHRVNVGNVGVNIELGRDGAPVVDLDGLAWVNGHDARDYAAAIVAACDLIEGKR